MNVQDGRADETGRETPNHAGWATFEARVRGRRFARCIERANIAIETGKLNDARAAVDEARALSPDAPEISELESRIASQPSPGAILLASDPTEFESDPGWPRMIAGMAVLVVLFSVVGFSLVQLQYAGPARQLLSLGTPSAPDTAAATEKESSAIEQETAPSERPESASSARRDEPNEPATPATVEEANVPPTPAPQARAPRPIDRDVAPSSERERSRKPFVAAPPPAAERPPTRLPETRQGTTGSLSRLDARPSPIATPAIEPVAVPVTTSISAAPTSTGVANAASTGAPPAAPVPASYTLPPAEPRPDESERIRSVLLRYETAYNRLDAKAAGSVWPRVDQAALGRAFNGLLSQRVSLGLCDITVIGDVGGASCAGKARWEPKIGGGLQTADRYWNFNLRRTGDGWRIEEIRVR